MTTVNSANPFRPAEQVAPKVKCLIYGLSGVGKTYLALTSPGPVAVIDTEGGTAFYADRIGRGGLSRFDVLPTKTFRDVLRAVEYLTSHPGEYETLVIDPVTVLYETLQDAAQTKRAGIRSNPDADLEMLDWQRIKRAYKSLMTDLVNLPMHVVVTARERDETEQRGRESVKIGVKPDAEKNTPYSFDCVIRLVAANGKRKAIIDKDRTGSNALGSEVAAPTFAKLFNRAIKAGGEATAERGLQDEDEAAATDAVTTFADRGIVDPTDPANETLVRLGPTSRSGVISRGEGRHSTPEWRQTPDGWHIGWLLEVGDGKAKPQVSVNGELASALFAATDNGKRSIDGTPVTVTGDLVEVHVPNRRMYYRFYATELEWDGQTLPPPPAVPVDAPSVPMFGAEDMAGVDAEVGATA